MQTMTETLQKLIGKPLVESTDQEIYLALLDLVRSKSAAQVRPVNGRKLYYISAEFLIGKLLSNNLINLGLYDDVRDALAAAGKSLSDIEEVEPEPSLGNGGLGRLAACFLDSLATLNLPGDGIGLRYHFGLFRQSFADGLQNELPDPWLNEHSWAEKTDITYPVTLAGKPYTARLYKLAVTGYEGRTNTLNLFDLDTIDESIVHDGIQFDKTAIAKNLTLFLYPDDSDEAGRMLRIYQQYLMVSAGAQLILAECAARGCNYHDLADYAAIQINDTHPSMVIPELIRLLGEKGIEFDEAVKIVTDTCAYTNHTILAEALETWPRSYLDKVVPQLMPVIEKLDVAAKKRTNDTGLAIIDADDRVHMAHMDIHFTHSTNGVAALHTKILKESELNGFYKLYPEKFNNKTNGITFRRWLLECDPRLTATLEKHIGSGFRKDAAELEKLLADLQTLRVEYPDDGWTRTPEGDAAIDARLIEAGFSTKQYNHVLPTEGMLTEEEALALGRQALENDGGLTPEMLDGEQSEIYAVCTLEEGQVVWSVWHHSELAISVVEISAENGEILDVIVDYGMAGNG